MVLDMVCGTEFDARALVQAVRDRARRCVVLSSADVYHAFDVFHGKTSGPRQLTPIREDSTLRVNTYPYRASGVPIYRYYDKLLVEMALRSSGLAALTVLRIPVVYGSNDIPLLTNLTQMRRRDPCIFFKSSLSRWRTCWSYIDNVAAAIIAASLDDCAAGQTYNVADQHSYSYFEWLTELARVCRWKGKLTSVADGVPCPELADIVNPLQNWELSTDKIRCELNLRDSVSWPETLERTLALTPGELVSHE
jgi:nucleoside-diphosphate-sugar epimerase